MLQAMLSRFIGGGVGGGGGCGGRLVDKAKVLLLQLVLTGTI